jgi:hypothetical protein
MAISPTFREEAGLPITAGIMEADPPRIRSAEETERNVTDPDSISETIRAKSQYPRVLMAKNDKVTEKD